MREAMKTRLADLASEVKRLEELVDAGNLNGMLLARATVAVDKAAASLERHRQALSAVKTSPHDGAGGTGTD